MSKAAEANQPDRHYPRVVAYPAKPQRHRAVNPFENANSLAMQHQDIADKVAGNLSRRTGHPAEDLRQIAMMGIIQASRRYNPQKGSFRAFARRYANGEVYHFLRDKGHLLKVPASWREKYSRGQKMLASGISLDNLLLLLGITHNTWRRISCACELKVVYLDEWRDY